MKYIKYIIISLSIFLLGCEQWVGCGKVIDVNYEYYYKTEYIDGECVKTYDWNQVMYYVIVEDEEGEHHRIYISHVNYYDYLDRIRNGENIIVCTE